jgi:chromosome partitioning protein
MTSQTAQPSQQSRICVTNAKGGTGKTTVAINIAGALNERGRDVLFVDLDPQGNASEGLGLQDAYDAEPPTIFDALTDHRQREVINDLVVEHEEMDVVPGNVDLLQAEHELTIADLMARMATDPDLDPDVLTPLALNITPEAITGSHAKDQLDRALAALDHEYDYIVIDSPPFFGELTDLGIYAARKVLIPALTEAASERAIELLFDQIGSLEAQTEIQVEDIGAVANRVETTNEDEEMIDWLNAVFADVPVWEVRKRVALQRAFSASESILAADPECDMAEVFRDMAAELDHIFENPSSENQEVESV